MIPFIGPILDIINKYIPDPDKQAELRISLEQEATKQMALQASVITKEAESASWITRNWRPITMCIFVGMLLVYFVMYTIIPFVIVFFSLDRYVPQDPGLNEQLIDVIKLGLGGYVASRGIEKAAKIVKK